MSTRDPMDSSGVLKIDGRDFEQSYRVIKTVDIDARGCPPFSEARYPGQGNEESRTVSQSVDHLIRKGFHMYHFMSVNGAAVGCRTWVVEVMREWSASGFLQPGSSFDELHEVAGRRWDRTLDSIPCHIFSGLFLSQPTRRVNATETSGHLENAGRDALQALEDALVDLTLREDRTDDDDDADVIEHNAKQAVKIRQIFEKLRSSDSGVKRDGLNSIARGPLLNGFEGTVAHDLTQAHVKSADHVRESLKDSHYRAYTALGKARELRDAGQKTSSASDIFTYYLAAVHDMFGGGNVGPD